MMQMTMISMIFSGLLLLLFLGVFFWYICVDMHKGGHFYHIKVLVAQSCPTLCDPPGL